MHVYKGKVVIVIFLAYKAAGILAKCTHFVFKRQRIADKLRLVKGAVDCFHNFVSHLNPHAYINRAGIMSYAMLRTELVKPVCAASACCNNNVFAENLKVFVPF